LEALRNMKIFVSLVFGALLLAGVGLAQSVPAVDVFGGYSYQNFKVPNSGATTSQSLQLNGWDASASILLFHHIAAEADISGHQLNDCAGVSGLKCDNFTYMFGPRITFGDRSSRATVFVHGLVGQDRADIFSSFASNTLSDTSVSVAAGGGFDYWFMRHIGVQLGPVDFLYTNHLNDEGASSQISYRAAAGVAFRFGGNFPGTEAKAPKEPKEKEAKSEGHRSWIRPWHKSKPETASAPTETEPTTSAPPQPRRAQPAPSVAKVPSRGMPIHSLGVVVAPQEFDGARILEIEPGSIAEMASLHVGDLIRSVDGKAVKTPMELAAEISDKTGRVRITIQRGTQTTETVILLGAH
jgi:PDZ domain